MQRSVVQRSVVQRSVVLRRSDAHEAHERSYADADADADRAAGLWSDSGTHQ